METTRDSGRNGFDGESGTEPLQLIVLTREYRNEAEGLYYVDSPALDIVEAGQTPQQASAVFHAALRYLVEGWLERGSLRSRLLELGYVEELKDLESSGGKPLTTFCPPALSETQNSINESQTGGSAVAYKALSYSFRGPLISAS